LELSNPLPELLDDGLVVNNAVAMRVVVNKSNTLCESAR
jgi:hypothetical protein